MKKWIFLVLALALAGVAYFYGVPYWQGRKVEVSPYTFGAVERGSLTDSVSATGTLSALETVVVGTQVSGNVEQVLVDFNDRVRQGQLLASIETEALDAARSDALAQYARAKAQLAEARALLGQFRPLFEQGVISKQDILPRETALVSAESSLQSAQSQVDRANKNLSNAEIRSPIDGIVIHRNIEPGQTVASSFTTPSLFTLARDLGRMQILALVDESDIGQIREEMDVRFSVAAYSEKSFTGRVRSIRLQPQTVQNVVSYTVVVDAENPEGVLLPGMTATVDFILSEIKDALLVPSAALRVKPSEEMLAIAKRIADERAKERAGAAGAGADPAAERRRDRGDRGDRGNAGNGEPRDRGARPARGGGSGFDLPPGTGRLWVDDGKGSVRPMMVKVGTTDGSHTQVTPLRGELAEGTQVVTAVTGAPGDASSSSNRRFRPMGF